VAEYLKAEKFRGISLFDLRYARSSDYDYAQNAANKSHYFFSRPPPPLLLLLLLPNAFIHIVLLQWLFSRKHKIRNKTTKNNNKLFFFIR